MRKGKKGFTLIELIVVVAILGILVLLAAPKFLGYTAGAGDALVKNDIKIAEMSVEKEILENPKYLENWVEIDQEALDYYIAKGALYNKKSKVTSSDNIGGVLYEIPKRIHESKLKGRFFVNEDGTVYYAKEDNVDSTKEDDFFWISDEDTKLNWGYYNPGKDEVGVFVYLGDEEVVNVPHSIQGVKITSYRAMFALAKPSLKKVISTNKEVTDMSYMFLGTELGEIDLSQLDTSNVTDMSAMFQTSKFKNLDLSSFDVSNLKDTVNMFYLAKSLTSINFDNWNTVNLENMNVMFAGATSLNSLDLTSFKTDNVKKMNMAFSELKLDELDLRNFNFNDSVTIFSIFNQAQINNVFVKNEKDLDLLENSENKSPLVNIQVK